MAAQQTEASSPDMEGPIALIAPELPEDTLMDVRKYCVLLHYCSYMYPLLSLRSEWSPRFD